MNKDISIMPIMTFQDFPLAPEIQQKLKECGFEQPTEIQQKAIPILLASNRVDFHGQAQTGTGKTLAFGLPLLQRIDRTARKTQALIIAPTRELAVQICNSLSPLASSIGLSLEAIYGGASIEHQLQKIRRGVHIVVGTPGRVLDLVRRNALDLNKVKTFVLDEADIMLEMGFKDDIDLLLAELSDEREIWLFSATVKSGIYAILKTHMKDPQSVKINQDDTNAMLKTKHFYCLTPQQNRLPALCRFIECNPDFYGFIFCQTKILAGHIAEQLLLKGYRVGALHGDLSQSQRDLIIRRFRDKELLMVVATDVAARGLDVPALNYVINFTWPEDEASYVHRSGRTGRAGKEGTAITFISKHELRDVESMQRTLKVAIGPINVPDRNALLEVRLGLIKQFFAKCEEMSDEVTGAHETCRDLVNKLSEEACRKALRCSLYNTFMKQIDDKEQFASHTQQFNSTGESSRSHAHSGVDFAEISINVGSDDGLQREDITAMLESKQIALATITKIRILKRCTFIHTQPDMINNCIEALNNTVICGRTVRAAKVQNSGGGSGPRERGSFYKGGDRSGGGNSWGGRSSSYSGGDRSNSYGDRSNGYGDRPPTGERAPFSDRGGSSRRREGGPHRGGPEVYQPHREQRRRSPFSRSSSPQ